jgi:hypothetical protein
MAENFPQTLAYVDKHSLFVMRDELRTQYLLEENRGSAELDGLVCALTIAKELRCTRGG